jgi:MinD superfamily P-loop ATPase
MATIHFIDGEKGGVGKSLFARVMVQYCLDKQLPYVLVEADQSNPSAS